MQSILAVHKSHFVARGWSINREENGRMITTEAIGKLGSGAGVVRVSRGVYCSLLTPKETFMHCIKVLHKTP
jgi:hypothetical protein